MASIQLTINSKAVTADVEPRTLLGELTVMLDVEHPEWTISLRRPSETVIVRDPGSAEAHALRAGLVASPLAS